MTRVGFSQLTSYKKQQITQLLMKKMLWISWTTLVSWGFFMFNNKTWPNVRPALRHALPSCAVCLACLLNEKCQHVHSQRTNKPRSELWSDLSRSLCVHHPALLCLQKKELLQSLKVQCRDSWGLFVEGLFTSFTGVTNSHQLAPIGFKRHDGVHGGNYKTPTIIMLL